MIIACLSEGNLERALQQRTGISEDAVIAYLPDGRRLTTENIRELAGAEDDVSSQSSSSNHFSHETIQTIYIFNKRYLEFELQDVLHELRAVPQLEPPIEGTRLSWWTCMVTFSNQNVWILDIIASTPPFRPHQLAAAYHHIAQTHSEKVSQVANAIRQQSVALSIASRNLDLNILALEQAFEPFAHHAQSTFEAQSQLLTSLETDLEAMAAVKVHPAFLSAALRRSIENGGTARTLGDYVSNDKMRQVAEGCSRISGE